MVYLSFNHEEKYSRGRRDTPGKGAGRETGARVQIPPSPLKIQETVASGDAAVSFLQCAGLVVRRHGEHNTYE